MPRRFFHAILLPLFLVLGGCAPERARPPAPAGPEEWLPLAIGAVRFEAQIALTPAEQQRGLMHRDSLPENGGMLFPYPEPQQMSFWMANTRIPLDIGFFDAGGLLLEVHRMVPYDIQPTRSRGRDLQFALEMPAGWFARNGLYPGQRLDLALLAEALRRRGADPARYGLAAE